MNHRRNTFPAAFNNRATAPLAKSGLLRPSQKAYNLPAYLINQGRKAHHVS
ncbi:hypothetical protein [Ardenticatena maritima]|uniref:hypothetical protein n=1 Tax=Ardenticatena maritima TaxID=872965 RepID=UPI0013792297|nr:hypothetical protein [Ardenticatena maritima]